MKRPAFLIAAIAGENTQLQPDIEVYNTPAEITSGNDAQLAAAVAALLTTLSK